MEKYAFVTGASRGIGKEIARQFAKNNIHLYLCCKNNGSLLQSFAKELEETYPITVKTFLGDLKDPSFVDSVFETIPSLDYLVNNAGISLVKQFCDVTYEEWNEVIHTNLTSALLCSQKALSIMMKNHEGRILNISSMWGQFGASMETIYSASKGGLDALTKALAKEYAPSGISINGLSLGFIDTEMNRHLSEEEREAFFAEIPIGRPGDPREAGEMAYQILTSPSYLTGQIIRMDGGLY